MRTFTKIHRPRGQQDPRCGGNADRVRDARTARNTVVNRAASSMPDTTRTTAPASLTSITGAAGAARGTGAAGAVSATIGTKPSSMIFLFFAGAVVTCWRAARRQPKTCCEQTCRRRATSDTRAPGTMVSAIIRAFSSADQRRRRAGPVRTSTRRYSPFASSLTSNMTIARSPPPQAKQPLLGKPLRKGVRAPLTKNAATSELFASARKKNAQTDAMTRKPPAGR